MVKRFHEILIWPLELLLPDHLKGDRQKDGKSFVARLSDEIIERSRCLPGSTRSNALWEPVDPLDRKTTEDADLQYSEFVYFHSFVQRVLYPAAGERNPPLAILSRKGIREVEVALANDEKLTLKVERIHLYLFRSETALVVVEVSSQGEMGLGTALQLIDQFRRAYAPYHWGGRGGHCPLEVKWKVADDYGGPVPVASDFGTPEEMYRPVDDSRQREAPMAAHWRWLIQPLQAGRTAGKDAITVGQLEDDRIPNMSWLGIEDPFSVSEGDMMRICFGDEKGNSDDYPYSRRFLSDFEKGYCYDRFWSPLDVGATASLVEYQKRTGEEWRFTRFLCSGYHFAVITKPAGYGDEILHHFRHHYFQLGLLAHFHRASLLRYSRRLTEEAVRAEETTEKNALRPLARVRREFADFINQYWFREVSNQDQGKEIFQLWSERLGNRELLDQLTREASAVDGILRQEYEDQQNTRVWELQVSTDRLTTAIFWLAGAALLIAFLDTELVRKLAAYGGGWLRGEAWQEWRMWWPLGVVTAAGLLGGYLGLRWFKRRLFASNTLPKREQAGADQG